MAITNTLEGVKVTIKLNDGSTATGTVKTKNLNLGSLNYQQWVTDSQAADQKAMNIVTALSPILDRRVYAIVRTNTYNLEQGE